MNGISGSEIDPLQAYLPVQVPLPSEPPPQAEEQKEVPATAIESETGEYLDTYA